MDCINLLASNALLTLPKDAIQKQSDDVILFQIDLINTYNESSATWLIVTNEVGLGLVPPYKLGRLFRDLGRANQKLADIADEVIFMVSGITHVYQKVNSMELFVIRHTEVQNPNNLCYGNYDISLKPNYEHKSKIFFKNLPNDLDQIYSSPSKRCTDLLDLHNLNFNIHNDLRELDFGDWEGKKWDDIDQTDLNYWMEDYVNRSPKNGENDRFI